MAIYVFQLCLCILLGFSPERREAMLLCPRAVARSPAVLPLMSRACSAGEGGGGDSVKVEGDRYYMYMY